MTELTQLGKFIAIETPLGEDELLLQSFSGSEGISHSFNFNLELLSANHDIQANEIIGKPVDVKVRLTDGSDRYFNGYILRFFAAHVHPNGTRIYYAEMVSWFHLLTLINDCRIFQNMDVKDIAEEVFTSRGYSDFEVHAQRTFKQREYTVQYRESDFQFISRLFEEEGIFYFFTHEQGKHTMIIGDAAAHYIDCEEDEANFYDGGHSGDQLTQWVQEYNMIPGKWSQIDYNYLTPKTDISSSFDTVIEIPGVTKFEQYDFPGLYADRKEGDALTKIRIEEEEVGYNIINSAGSYRSFTAGGKFTLAHHEIEAERNQEYVITSITHNMRENSYDTGETGAHDYSNSFLCIPSETAFRPLQKTPKPIVSGVQTAVVVGPSGEEIYTDEQGRIKIQFHWDRVGEKNENSSCWIRVSQVHAGKGFGAVDIPRIDEEVIVTFLEGDVDRPIVIGRVYNDDNKPPGDLPSAGMISGLKSNSTPAGGGYNQMIMDDTKGKEAMTIHAQYDRSTTVQNDDSLTINNNRTVTVKTNQTVSITEGKLSHDVVAGTADYHVAGAVTEKYDDTQTTIVNGDLNINSKTGNINVKSDAATISIDAASKITLHSGASTIELDSAGNIKIEGANVSIKGSATVAIASATVTSEGKVMHHTKGALVLSEGSATNTIKGGMVMLNP